MKKFSFEFRVMTKALTSLFILICSYANIAFATEANTQKLDLLFFLHSGECAHYPYKILKDLDGNKKFEHIKPNEPIIVNISSLASSNYTIWRDPKGYQSPKNVNRKKIIAEMFGRSVTEDIKSIVSATLVKQGIKNIEFRENFSPKWHCDFPNSNHVNIILRADLALNPYGPVVEKSMASGETLLLGIMPYTQVFSPIRQKVYEEGQEDAKVTKLLKDDDNALAALIQMGEFDDYNSLDFQRACFVNDKDPERLMAKLGFSKSKAVIDRFGRGNKLSLNKPLPSIEVLWKLLQQQKCTLSIINGAEFRQLLPSLEQDPKNYYRVETSLSADDALEGYVISKGYPNLAAFNFAKTFSPTLSKTEVKIFADYGVKSQADVEAILSRMSKSNYASNPTADKIALFQFLDDEAAAKKSGISVIEEKQRRIDELEKRQKEAAIRAKRIATERAKRSFTMGVVCMGREPAGGHLKRIIDLYARNAHTMTISEYIRAMPGCLLPRSPQAISGAKLVEFYRIGRFVGLRTIDAINGQYIYGMIVASDWDLQN